LIFIDFFVYSFQLTEEERRGKSVEMQSRLLKMRMKTQKMPREIFTKMVMAAVAVVMLMTALITKKSL
jgi:hypothetical protein